MTPAWVCGALEVALNRQLRLEPEVLADLTRLDGRVLRLSLSGLDWDFYLEIAGDTLRVLPEFERSDARLSATPLAYAAYAARLLRQEPGLPANVMIEGDAELFARFTRLLQRVGFDPAEQLSKVIGDGPAVRLTGLAKELFGWGLKSAQTLGLNTAEYLREETYDLARKIDAEEWMDAVDVLRDGVERLEARLMRLES